MWTCLLPMPAVILAALRPRMLDLACSMSDDTVRRLMRP